MHKDCIIIGQIKSKSKIKYKLKINLIIKIRNKKVTLMEKDEDNNTAPNPKLLLATDANRLQI